jgi:exosortase/archaeosortase family protein
MNRLLTYGKQRVLLTALALSFAAVVIDNWAAPALHNHSPLWTIAFFAALTLRRSSDETSEALALFGLPWSWTRLALFALLHGGIVTLGHIASSALVAAANGTTVPAGLIASLKYFVLLPTFVLFPVREWSRIRRAYAAELVVAGLVLFTWNPFRIMETLWPWYSALLGRAVHGLAGIFVPGLGYSPGPVPTLLGPHLDVSVIFACSGLVGIRLFQLLFGIILVTDWNRLNKRRALWGYFAGCAAMVFANALRIVFLVVFGNRVSTNMAVRYHVTAGWYYFALVFLLLLFTGYRWLLRPGNPASQMTS